MNVRGFPRGRGCPQRGHGVPAAVRDRVVGWIEAGHFPGAVVGLWERGTWRWRFRAGWAVVVPRRIPLRGSSLFDLASLTKPLVAAALVLAEAGRRWSLEVPLHDLDPDLGGPWERLTLADVLRHTAGFAAWVPLYLVTATPEERYAWLTVQADPAAPHRPAVYSCLDYQWLGLWLQRHGVSLVEFVRQAVWI